MDQVMARGDHREAMVRDDGDRRTFVRTLGEAGGSLAGGDCAAIGLAREGLKKDRKARKYREDILKNATLNDLYLILLNP